MGLKPSRTGSHVTRCPGLPCSSPHPLPGTARTPGNQGLACPQLLMHALGTRHPQGKRHPTGDRRREPAQPTGTSPSSLPHPGVRLGALGAPSPCQLLLAWVSQPLLPELALAAPACSRATDVVLWVSIPVPVFLLLQPLEQQLVREAPQGGPRGSCRLRLALQVDVAGRALQGPRGGQAAGAGQPPPLRVAGGFPEWHWGWRGMVRFWAARQGNHLVPDCPGFPDLCLSKASVPKNQDAGAPSDGSHLGGFRSKLPAKCPRELRSELALPVHRLQDREPATDWVTCGDQSHQPAAGGDHL